MSQTSDIQFNGLYAHELTVSRSEQVLLEDAELHLAPSTITYLHGENGAGKTTLMRCLAGLLPADHGSMYWNKRPITHPESGYFQDLIFLAHSLSMKNELSIAENLAFYASLRMRCSITGKPLHQKISSVLEELGIGGLEDRMFAELSAGQQHKVALARLILEPAKIWILDEPFVNLDHKTRSWLSEKAMAFKQQGGTVLFTSHHHIEELPIDQSVGVEHE
ncbi:heme ABC exporter ATP-binding protein CcmA [Kangiella sediminilitoris]|uniref:Cytochrome c biogenesis ATP-binding export protein CcmA n=1 Tax=Kangiella sediminilitoris TaxID=1144748 RepID=A0A1B3B9V9_9GAMM|nr:heme ABC exporter ATP-binding protein CcmA [Kangiella sediminilitoris]AOE49565.1 Cytochrome c biogenesis ATP-binding export protein CcmA [Kangiella sediminilitoris]